jgi:D-alanyl-D-alanine carboxypeptidase/D-alanyl-D-alanine-endopeptidase (penicillin-binding protein 4)
MGAPGTTENGVLVAKRFLEDKVGFVPGSYVLKNGSGLNDTNRFSARQLAKLIAFDQRNFETGNELTTSLAIAGTQGTIGFRMRDTPAQRHLRAKTGTLHGVSALSGVVSDPSGDVVVFSILTQGLKNGISPAWKAQNDIGVALASGGTFHPGDDKSDSDAVSLNATPYVRERALGGAP